MKRLTLLFVASTLAIFVTACGGGGGGTPPPQNVTCSFGANPTSVTKGASSSLTWNCSYETSAALDGATVAASGSKSVSPTATTTYTLVAEGTGGPVTYTVKVTVTSPPAPTCSLSANPNVVSKGISTSLAWTTTGNPTSATVDNGVGAVTPPQGGSTSVTPATSPTTTYILNVTNASGSGSCSVAVTVNVPWTIGNGAFTSLQFTANIPAAADRNYITSKFNVAYPLFVQQFGLPPDTGALTVDLCSWSYDGNNHKICVTILPTTNGTDQNSWDAVFLHELSAAMWLSQHTGVGSNVYAEALGDIGSVLGQRVTGLKGQAFFGNELDYDVYRLGGKEIVGGVPGKALRNTNVLGAGLNEAAALTMLQILVGTQSLAAVADWPNYSALKSVKSALYAKANACQCNLQDSDFYAALAALPQPVEGVLPDVWVAAQPTAYTAGTPGTYLYAYPAPAANPQWLAVVAFVRLNKEIYPGIKEEDVCTSGTVSATVTNASGTVQTLVLDLASASHEVALNSSKLPLGSYRVQTSGTCNGVAVTAPDSYFGAYDPALVPFPKSIGTLASSLFLIGVNPNGTPSAKTFPAPSGGPAGSFLQNTGGAAVWQVAATNIPQPEYTLQDGRKVYVPLPFSPVIVSVNP